MKDPICGMEVAEPPKIKMRQNGKVYGFCSEGCLKKFAAGQASQPMDAAADPAKGYFILAGVFAFLMAVTVLRRQSAGDWGSHEVMADFMGYFFMVFGAFKMLDLKAFADAFSTYDILAAKYRPYGLFYPFFQVGLGFAYAERFQLPWVSVIALVVMTISSVGVAKALLSKKKIRCACLGTKIALPMSTISLVEDVLMVGMSAFMLW